MKHNIPQSILLEGLDGAGKSTQVRLLQQYLEDRGHKVLLLREPGGSDYYETIRTYVHFSEYQRPALSDALTCAAGIAANIELSRQAMAEGKWVITDRSFISNIVYQIAQGLTKELAEEVTAYGTAGFVYSKRFLIDVPVELSQKRLEHIGKKKDHWESKGVKFFKTVRARYLDAAEKYKMTIIDGSESIETVQAKIRAIVDA